MSSTPDPRGATALVLPDVLTSREARDTQRVLDQSLRQRFQQEPKGAAAEVTVDASGLRRFDSAALAVLLECQRLAQAQGRGISVAQPPPKLVELARLYGVEGLLSLPTAAGPIPA